MSALGHNWRVLRDALAEERKKTATHIAFAEPDFLPAALEVVEKPVSPTARVTGWISLTGLLLMILWLTFGHVDIVASARGRILPADNVKLVQAASTGIVRRIYVRDGDFVRKGQVLVDLDPTVSTADQEQAARALLAAQLDVARNRAIADALAGKGLHFAPPPGTAPDVAETQLRLVEAQVAETNAAVASMASARQSSLADAQAAAQQVRKYNETLPLIDRQLRSLDELDRVGLISQSRLLEMRRQRRAELGDRDVALAQRFKGISDAARFDHQLAQARQEALRQALSDLAKAQSEAAVRAEELTKARQHSSLQRLVSPADGIVQQLAIHTLGGIVEPIKPIMVIVPEGGLIVEAKILNRDAGFVRAGQDVAIKLEAFPFTRFGTVPGRITSISRDAVDDRKLGSVYVARIELTDTHISSERGKIPLVPGMTLTADVSTGRRTLFSYLISPIEGARREAARER